MVDENGKQTITNDGATVMKVTIDSNPFQRHLRRANVVSPSSWTLSTRLPASSSILPGRKTPK